MTIKSCHLYIAFANSVSLKKTYTPGYIIAYPEAGRLGIGVLIIIITNFGAIILIMCSLH